MSVRALYVAFAAFCAAAAGVVMFVAMNGRPGLGLSDRGPSVAPEVTLAGHLPKLATPTPTATPTPEPVAPECTEPRSLDTRGYVMLPAAEDSIFQNCQVIAYYGFPRLAALGVLGEFDDPDALASALADLVVEYDGVNGPRTAVGAFHIIAAAAQPDATGDALYRIPSETAQEYIDAAAGHDQLVFLDLQMGHSTIDKEFGYVADFLRNPRVHLAIDPEWSMPPGVAPGAQIGSIDAEAINRAQELLEQIAEETGVRKMLVVHQFTPAMIARKELLRDYPNVDLVIDMDGFGSREVKLAHYQRFVVDDHAEHSGLKLFIDEDTNIFSPAEASEIVPQPDIIQYQ
ncbi:MAG: hypothetical protein ACM3S1_03235 [Hyphomicrobiales bacterium]